MSNRITKTSWKALVHRLKSCHVNSRDFISVAGKADFGCLFASLDYLVQSEIICFGSFVVRMLFTLSVPKETAEEKTCRAQPRHK